jgi:DUF4097 and DUF4098 domain-containing protein YvlB
MAGTRPRSSGLFSGLVLISVGLILLLHYFGNLQLGAFFTRWWPLLIIFWGVVKLYERTAGRRFGGSGGGITGNEVWLVLGMFALLAIVVAAESTADKIKGIVEPSGDNFEFDADVTPRNIPANAPVLVRTIRGDISVRASDDPKIEVSAKKNIKTWNETDAQKIATPVRVEISQNGDTYEVQPAGYDTSDSRISLDLDVAAPKKSPLTVKTDKGDVTTSDFESDVNVSAQTGDVEVRNTTGEVSIETKKGDVKVSDTNGDVRISGKGGEIEVNNTSGSLTVDGDFYGPIRADRIPKGVRLVSPKTDLTISSVAGHIEAGSGNIDIIDAPGNVTLRTRDNEVNLENPGGKVQIDNRNAQTNVRFTSQPKEDITITNSSSGISLTLPGSSSFEIVADCRNCDIESEFPGLDTTKSESGDSHIAAKYGSGKGPKITLRTSYGNITLSRTTIEPHPTPHPTPNPTPHPTPNPAPFTVPKPPNPPVPPATEQ